MATAKAKTADVLDEATMTKLARERVITGMQAMSRNSYVKQLAVK